MIRVTIFCSFLVRQGPINVLYNMLCAYKRLDSEVEYRVLTLSPESEGSRQDEYEALGIKVESLNLPSGYAALRNLGEIKRRILETSPDICQSSGFRADMILSMINLPGVKKVSTLWNYPYDDYQMDYGNFKGGMMAFSHLVRLRKFDRTIPCSGFIADKIRKYGMKLTTIYTGVPMDYFKPLDDDERLARRQNLGIPKEAKVFIFIANLISRKNPEVLIKAFQKIPDDSIMLLVMGDGPLFESCKAINGNNNHVRFLGRQPGTLHYLQVSDFYISPSLSEGFPTAVLEAMSVGVMPVLSNIAPHVEMLEGVPYDVTFSPNDEDGLRSSVYKAVSHVGEFDYREYMEKNFSDTLMFRRFESVYKELLSR